jgi:hypothetical protein
LTLIRNFWDTGPEENELFSLVLPGEVFACMTACFEGTSNTIYLQVSDSSKCPSCRFELPEKERRSGLVLTSKEMRGFPPNFGKYFYDFNFLKRPSRSALFFELELEIRSLQT